MIFDGFKPRTETIPNTKQSRVSTWVRSVFSEKEATDVPERALRTAEEALELAHVFLDSLGKNNATVVVSAPTHTNGLDFCDDGKTGALR